MRDFTLNSEHYQKVHQNLANKLSESEFDAIIGISPQNIIYLSGTYVPTHKAIPDRLYLILFPQDGPPAFIVCEIVEYRVRHQSNIENIKTYKEFEQSPIQKLAEVVRQKDLQKGNIGIELDFLTASYYQELLNLLPKTEFINCSEFLEKVRMIKTKEEIELLRNIATLTEKAIMESYIKMRPPDDEQMLKKHSSSAITRLGADNINFSLISSGPATMGQPIKGTRKIETGDLIKLDLSGYFQGYNSDLIRMATVGKPSSETEAIYKKYKEIHNDVVEKMQSGNRTNEIFEFAQHRFEKEEGFRWRETQAHCGHSLGTGLHDYPILSPTCKEKLAPNMVINVEPIAHFPEVGGFQIEETVRVTEDKPEVLSTYMNTEELFTIK